MVTLSSNGYSHVATFRLVRLAYRANCETRLLQACGGPAGLDVAIFNVAYDDEGLLLSLLAACVSLGLGIIHVCRGGVGIAGSTLHIVVVAWAPQPIRMDW